ncbi:MAG: tetratricopeptide repeat protein [Candidatus Hydrogenedentes bacterium]|nr:tetratricopeptide repeat protein [Candidatus Hydrogenedentota bacterium]
MRVKGWQVLFCGLLFTAAGCGTLSGGSRDQTQSAIFDTQRRVASLEKNLTKFNETAATLSTRVDETDRQNLELKGLMEENQVRLDTMGKKVDQLTSTIYRQLNLSPPVESSLSVGPSPGGVEVGTPKIQPPKESPGEGTSVAETEKQMEATALESSGVATVQASPGTSATGPAGTAATVYQRAIKAVRERRYEEAYTLFDEYLQRYPKAEEAANAQFWKADSLRCLGRDEEAVEEYEKLRANYSSSVKVPIAMANEATICHNKLGQTERAIKLLEEVVTNYPMAPAAEKAKNMLKTLRGS